MIDSLKTFYAVFAEEIQKEINGEIYDEHDRAILNKICSEINTIGNTRLQYLIELERVNVPGAGHIIAQYIEQFHSEWAKACLLDRIVWDRVPGADQLILKLFAEFDRSETSFHISANHYVMYDNALWRLKPKKRKKELFELAQNLNFAYNMPFTLRVLSSWKLPEMKDVLLAYLLDEPDLSKIKGVNHSFDSHIRREIIFRALSGLKYYPSEDVKNAVLAFMTSEDELVRNAAAKTMKILTK